MIATRATDENAFKEILDQQEDEYENELKQLIGKVAITCTI